MEDLEARVAALEAAIRPSVVYVVLSDIRNVEAFRDKERAEARLMMLAPRGHYSPATAMLVEVPLV